MATVEQRVAQGAELLDRERPDWAASVDVDDLQMHSCYFCVLGQLYGDYVDGLQTLSGRAGYEPEAVQWACAHGFDDEHNEYEWLENLWRDAIDARTRAA